MALLFFDNFGGYATADLAKAGWNLITGGTAGTVVSSGGRQSGPYFQTATLAFVSEYRTTGFAASATVTVGFAFIGVTTFTGNTLVGFYDNGTIQCALAILGTGQLRVVRGTTTDVTSGTSVSALAIDTWYYIEMKVTIADSIGAGTCEVRVNGSTWITVATGQDLKSTANATCNMVSFGKLIALSATFRYTDIYIDNGTTFLGDCTVSTLTVSGAGTTNTLTTGTSADVDDATPDSDSTYAESAVNGQLATFAMSNLPSVPTTIHAVSPQNCVRKTDGGAKQFGAVVRSGGTDYVQATANALDSFIYDAPILTVDPATGVAWVAAGVNAVEVGVKVLS